MRPCPLSGKDIIPVLTEIASPDLDERGDAGICPACGCDLVDGVCRSCHPEPMPGWTRRNKDRAWRVYVCHQRGAYEPYESQDTEE